MTGGVQMLQLFTREIGGYMANETRRQCRKVREKACKLGGIF